MLRDFSPYRRRPSFTALLLLGIGVHSAVLCAGKIGPRTAPTFSATKRPAPAGGEKARFPATGAPVPAGKCGPNHAALALNHLAFGHPLGAK